MNNYKKCPMCGELMQWNSRGHSVGFECSVCPHDEMAIPVPEVETLRAELEVTHKNAAPINAETVRELMDEREMLKAKVEQLTSFNRLWKEKAKEHRFFNNAVTKLLRTEQKRNNKLTAELAASKQENGNLFDQNRMLAQEVLGRDADIERLETELDIERERAEKAEKELKRLLKELASDLLAVYMLGRYDKDHKTE